MHREQIAPLSLQCFLPDGLQGNVQVGLSPCAVPRANSSCDMLSIPVGSISIPRTHGVPRTMLVQVGGYLMLFADLSRFTEDSEKGELSVRYGLQSGATASAESFSTSLCTWHNSTAVCFLSSAPN